jgi:hypothetical protein
LIFNQTKKALSRLFNVASGDGMTERMGGGPLNRMESALGSIELGLSYVAAVPWLNIVPAVIKVAMGAIQAATAGIIAGTVGLPKYLYNGDQKILGHACTHIVHGGANIGAGLLELIPGVGLVAIHARLLRTKEETAHYLPYSRRFSPFTQNDKLFPTHR